MSRKEIIIDQEHMYALTMDDENKYFLEVVCGGIAMENIVLPLTTDEIEKYKLKGKSFLDQLSWEVCKKIEKYENRIIYE